MNKLLLVAVPTIALTGCFSAVTKFVSEKEDIVVALADAATGMGPKGVIASLGVTTLLGLAKWWQGEQTLKRVVQGVQEGKKNLSPQAKAHLSEGLNMILSEKNIKKIKKIKNKLEN